MMMKEYIHIESCDNACRIPVWQLDFHMKESRTIALLGFKPSSCVKVRE